MLFRHFFSFSLHSLAILNIFHFQLCGLTIGSVLSNELWRWSSGEGDFWGENIYKRKRLLALEVLGMGCVSWSRCSHLEQIQSQQQSQACRLRLAQWRDGEYLDPNYITELLIHLSLKPASQDFLLCQGKSQFHFLVQWGGDLLLLCAEEYILAGTTAKGQNLKAISSLSYFSLLSFHHVLIFSKSYLEHSNNIPNWIWIYYI